VMAASKRIDKAKRKALLAKVTIEKVDPFVVFDRDKWKCQLCGVKTPLAKRGTYDDDAPELDHIVTLKDGGEHSYRNTQCACRRCNRAKGGRSYGQLLLAMHWTC
jgi:5-methylcytosine-specific restriction endonuclease McrA